MKSLLIKLGKIGKAIKQDGLIVGGGRVLGYLKKYFKTILNFKSGQVLIVTGGVGDSALYRAYNVSEELNLHDIKTEVMIQDNPLLPKFADKFSVFIFQRTRVTPAIEKLIVNIKKQNKEIIFETDDLVFDVKHVHASDAYMKMSALEKKQYEKGVGEEIINDEYVQVCTTTTSYLAKILESYGKKVFIVPNKLSENDLKIADEVLQTKNQQQKSEFIRIGYFSGTLRHDRDFATVSDALVMIMEKYAKVKLVLVGSLNIGEEFERFESRIERLPFAPRKKHFADKAGVDINISPLEFGDPFCESKSEIKFFGSGILKVPTVAVANQTFSEAIEDGVDGFLAKDTEEWVAKLSRLIEDENLRTAMGEKAREKALRKYTNKNSGNEEYYEYLRSKIQSEI